MASNVFIILCIAVVLLMAMSLSMHMQTLSKSTSGQRSDTGTSMMCEVPHVSSHLENITTARTIWGEAIKPLTLNRVCLDGEAIVVHDPSTLETLEAGLTEAGLPGYDASIFWDFHRHESSKTHPLRPVYGQECQFNKVAIRFPSSAEVKEPKYFSKCTLPVIIFSNWVSTYGEFFTTAPSWLWALQNNIFEEGLEPSRPILDRNLTAVLASCHNYPLSPYHAQLMQPFSRYPVSTWRSFASLEGNVANQMETSVGKVTRCYDKVVILGFSEASWANSYAMAQHTLRFYKERGQVPDVRGRLFSRSEPEVLRILFEYRSLDSQPRSASNGAGSISQKVPASKPLSFNDPGMTEEYDRTKSQYHFLDDITGDHKQMDEAEFKKRPVFPGTRQILNLQEVLDQCNNNSIWAKDWLVKLNKTKVECRAYSFSDLFEGMAVAQLIDVFISLHGSGEMNAMFMRKDTIKIQFRPKGFGFGEHAYLSNGYWPQVCDQNQFPFFCWFLNFEGDQDWEPGIFERLGLFTGKDSKNILNRDRHLRLRFDLLKKALGEIMTVEREEYMERWRSNKVGITFGPGDGEMRHQCVLGACKGIF